ncbi:MAG: hypothetical protein A2174_00755 [Candidatus Portnoybacteria bacterium RBG_13_41_18]|uniref:M23ase beta-sheet core domain-containing protein n=1 Tax=Candidatus Portnoybacteria bacterium RBG_13_41_18 TaxID=1801991 RepID=A0A1G2FAG4_9BACT|nr:MAG: hypothetical protein A2174_00755 [Candidatus Portnoybacteria bacterium RBG_13_41_18]
MLRFLKKISIYITISIFALSPILSIAETQNDLQRQIQEKQALIQQLEKQIAEYNEAIINQKAQESTLAKQINNLQIQINRLETEIKLTQTKISSANLKIEQLTGDIKTKNDQIAKQKNYIAETMRVIYEYDQETPLGLVLKNDNFSDFLNQAQSLETLQSGLSKNLNEIKNLKSQLETQKTDYESQKNQLLDLRDELTGKNLALDNQIDQKADLLVQTKNQEKKYQQIMSDLQKKQQDVEKEIYSLEETLRLLVDINLLPGTAHGLLGYPASATITQGYGPTSQTGFINSVYSFHNGIDFGVKSGTPVKAAADGVVKAIGNNGKYAYGKWIAIDHQNGLITLYAHFSGYAVANGQKVERGVTIGYSGNTGFSTGPHLHFTVYDASTFSTEQKWYGLLPLGGSINPMDYL